MFLRSQSYRYTKRQITNNQCGLPLHCVLYTPFSFCIVLCSVELRNKLASTRKHLHRHCSIFENVSTDRLKTGTSTSPVEFEVVNIGFSDYVLLVKLL